MKLNWQVNQADWKNILNISKEYGISFASASVIVSKGFDKSLDLNLFLHPDYSGMHSPFLMKNMSEAVIRIKEAIASGKKLAVFSDSDLDGLTSLSIINNILVNLKANVIYDFPKDGEKYGLNIASIDRFHRNNAGLIITLDCGIRDFEEIKYAKEKNIDVIVCDHHESDDETPDAICVDPKQNDCPYPFKELAGVGVALKLAHGLLLSFLPVYNKVIHFIISDDKNFSILTVLNGVEKKFQDNVMDISEYLKLFSEDSFVISLGDNSLLKNSDLENKNIFQIEELIPLKSNYNVIKNLTERFTSDLINKRELLIKISNYSLFVFSDKIFSFLDEMMPIAAIGTIADVVPLINENRIIVKYGLQGIKTSNHPSVSKIREHCMKDYSSKKISWSVAPLLNTPGRYGLTSMTADFFLKDNAVINDIYPEIMKLNDERKTLIVEILDRVTESIDDYDNGSYIFFSRDDLHDGLTGIIAGRLSEKYNKPCIAVNFSNEDDISKGSGRAPGNINLFSYIEKHSDIFERFGGHAQAFGFSIHNDNVQKFSDLLENVLSDIETEDPFLQIDAVVDVTEIDKEMINSLNILEPYGQFNSEPLFASRNVKFNSVSTFGKKNEHLKIIADNCAAEFIWWRHGEDLEKLSDNKTHDLVYKLSNSEFRGIITPRAYIEDCD